MKKRLSLKTETLRGLTPEELARAGGGGTLMYTPGIPSIRITIYCPSGAMCAPAPLTISVVVNPSR